jgi:hypothetical protein
MDKNETEQQGAKMKLEYALSVMARCMMDLECVYGYDVFAEEDRAILENIIAIGEGGYDREARKERDAKLIEYDRLTDDDVGG